MPDVTISYKGNSIATMSASGTKTLLTEGKYCEDDITVAYTAPTPSAGSATTPNTNIPVTPTITVSSSGLITTTVNTSQSVTPTVVAGYVSSGTAGTITVSGSNATELTTKTAQTYTPTTTNQTISSGQYLTGTQTILGDANLLAENIKKDVSIFGVTGTFEGGGGGGVQTAYVTDVSAADVLYYTDANMTFQSGRFIDDAYLPLGTIVFVHDDGPSIPIPPTGLTQRAQFTSGMHKYTVYEVTG